MDPSTFILIVLGVYAVLAAALPLIIGDSNERENWTDRSDKR
jgi:hypothetical protein